MAIRSTDGVIGPGLVVRGHLRGKGDLAIEGNFEGEVDLDGALSVGASGTITGPVRATDLEVLGEVIGNVAGQGVILRSSARIVGDVRALSLTIDDGAALDGLIEMGEDGRR